MQCVFFFRNMRPVRTQSLSCGAPAGPRAETKSSHSAASPLLHLDRQHPSGLVVPGGIVKSLIGAIGPRRGLNKSQVSKGPKGKRLELIQEIQRSLLKSNFVFVLQLSAAQCGSQLLWCGRVSRLLLQQFRLFCFQAQVVAMQPQHHCHALETPFAHGSLETPPRTKHIDYVIDIQCLCTTTPTNTMPNAICVGTCLCLFSNLLHLVWFGANCEAVVRRKKRLRPQADTFYLIFGRLFTYFCRFNASSSFPEQ